MKVLSSTDPRDNLERARRRELVKFAEVNGIREVVSEMPATLMRKILRARGLTQIAVQPTRLGDIPRQNFNKKVQPKPQAISHRQLVPEPRCVEVSADDDLMRQWSESQGVKAETDPLVKGVNPASVAVVEHRPFRDPANPKMGELKKEAKRRGLKPPRTMKMPELKKLMGL